MKYREHRGGLKESMDTMITVNSFKELFDAVFAKWPKMTGIKFEYMGIDHRIEWHTYFVMIQLGDDWIPVGMSDGNNFSKK